MKPTHKSGAPSAVWSPVNEKFGGLPTVAHRPRCQLHAWHAKADAKAPAIIFTFFLGRQEPGRGKMVRGTRNVTLFLCNGFPRDRPALHWPRLAYICFPDWGRLTGRAKKKEVLPAETTLPSALGRRYPAYPMPCPWPQTARRLWTWACRCSGDSIIIIPEGSHILDARKGLFP